MCCHTDHPSLITSARYQLVRLVSKRVECMQAAPIACERSMPKPTPAPTPSGRLNYRRRLLAILDAFLDPGERTYARAHRLVDRLFRDPRRQGRVATTLDWVVWDHYVSELIDSECYDDPDY